MGNSHSANSQNNTNSYSANRHNNTNSNIPNSHNNTNSHIPNSYNNTNSHIPNSHNNTNRHIPNSHNNTNSHIPNSHNNTPIPYCPPTQCSCDNSSAPLVSTSQPGPGATNQPTNQPTNPLLEVPTPFKGSSLLSLICSFSSFRSSLT